MISRNFRAPSRTIPLVVLLLLAACGGAATGPAGGGSTGSTLGLFATGSTEVQQFSAHLLSSNDAEIQTNYGFLDRASNELELGPLDATTTDGLTSITLDSGGQITVEEVSREFLAIATVEPTGASALLGIVGLPTQTSDLPTGAIRFDGATEVQILNGSGIYDLTGDARIDIDFRTPVTNITLRNLDGTYSDGASAPRSVNNAAIIEFRDLGMSNGAFSGGWAQITNNNLGVSLTATQTVSTSGAVFGPNAEEVGGVTMIDDRTGAGSLYILGYFHGER